MIEIDCSNAGGQVVRTAVALSALTGTPVRITNIRGARPEPGLKVQHTEGVRAMGELCGADIRGLELGSRTLQFFPEKLAARNVRVELSTAGSVGLVLQALLIPASQLTKPIIIDIIGGGTWNKWAPPVPYFEKVLFPLIGDSTKVSVKRDGFYPKGGALVEVESQPFEPRNLLIAGVGDVDSVEGLSIASSSLEKAKVAERQAQAAALFIERKFGQKPDIEIRYVDAKSPGSGILLVARSKHMIIGSDIVGEIGMPSEKVGERAAEQLAEDLANGAVDRHASDMLLPYMAIRGSGKIYASAITDHVLANISVIESFMPVKFRVDGKKGGPGIITVS